MTVTRLRIHPPADFSFWHTAYSHGWCSLPPFAHDVKERTLDRVLLLADGSLAACTLRAPAGTLRIDVRSRGALTTQQRREIVAQLSTCLRLAEDFRPFHAAARRAPGYRWIAASRAGRLLRAPTVFEDLVKMICTTNCTWALTTLMVTRLVETFGVREEGVGISFPTPEALAWSDERTLRSQCSTGYRAPYLLAVARTIAEGKMEVEPWRTSALATDALEEEMLTLPGVGPYAAGNLLRLVGRYDRLGLDSWVRGQFAKVHTRGRQGERPDD
jgi:N-glycosylase/DNA lyase